MPTEQMAQPESALEDEGAYNDQPSDQKHDDFEELVEEWQTDQSDQYEQYEESQEEQQHND